MKNRRSKFQYLAGFTLIEMVVVILLVGILSAYAIMKNVSPADATLPSQAQVLATDLRHAQTLASTWGVSLTVSASGHVYSVSCSNASTTAPCNGTSPVVDPATGAPFSVDLQKAQSGVTFASPTTAALTFDSLGKPDSVATATYTLSSGSSTSTVTVEATTGKVTP